jgi:hypothetical protein
MIVNRATQNSAASVRRSGNGVGVLSGTRPFSAKTVGGQIMAIGDTLTPISHAPASSRLVS